MHKINVLTVFMFTNMVHSCIILSRNITELARSANALHIGGQIAQCVGLGLMGAECIV